MRRFTRTVGKANAIQLAWKRHGGDIKTDDYLAKLSGVLDPNRVPTIPFSTRLGPVPVRVPTCIFISFLFYSWIRIGMRTNPASVGSIGDREIKKFSDFPPPHLVQPSPLPLVSILQAQEQKVAFLRLACKTKLESFGFFCWVKVADLTLISIPCNSLKVKLDQHSLNYWHLD